MCVCLPDDALGAVVVQSSEKHQVDYAFSDTPSERKTVDLCVYMCVEEERKYAFKDAQWMLFSSFFLRNFIFASREETIAMI